MITYRLVKKFDKSFLDGYKRFSKTSEMYVLKNDCLVRTNTDFIDEWDQGKLESISEYFKELVGNGGYVMCAFDKKKVVGFMTIDSYHFNGYVHVPYVHIDREYRGKGIGKKLFFITSLKAIELGYQKLYISAHPSVETMGFYKSVGCELAGFVNEDLKALEPLDIQLEYVLNLEKVMFDLVLNEFSNYERVTASVIGKVASTLYKYLPKDEKMFLRIVKSFIQEKNIYGYFSVGTFWVKKRSSVIHKGNMEFFADIVLNDLVGWAEVDQFCYRVMNPMIELDESYYSYLDEWSRSDNKDVRRVSLVSMIYTDKGGLKLRYDMNQMFTLVERLKEDTDIHVRKAVGWVLKCAFVRYPKEVERYLRDNVKNLDRLIFRYALEHVKDPLRKELMSL